MIGYSKKAFLPASLQQADHRENFLCPPLRACTEVRWLHVLLLTTSLLVFSSASRASAPAFDSELRDFLKQTISQANSFKDKYDAEVWLVDMSTRLSRFVKDPQKRLHLLRSVHREAKAANLKPDLVLAVIEIESRFNRFAVSRVGAQGLMQVMPFWKDEIGRPEDNLTDIETNLRYGCRILQFYIQKERGHISSALARYNGSYGKTWYPEKVMTAWQDRWFAGDM